MTRFKTALAALLLVMGSPFAAAAATITDSDTILELGGVIDTFQSASLTELVGPTGTTTSIVGQNLLTGTTFAASSNSGSFSILYTAFPTLSGVERETYSGTGVVEILFESTVLSPLAPSGLFLLQFNYVPFASILQGAPLLGSATLYQVSQIPLPAGLLLLFTGLGTFWAVRRSG